MDVEDNEEYRKVIEGFRLSVFKAVEIHAKIRHLPLQGIAPTASLMFARIMLMGTSILRLCPQAADAGAVWDFTSIAILARSLFEAIMFFRYFCEPTEADEWIARMMLLHFHDRCERVRRFTEMDKPDDVAGFQGEADEYREALRKNDFFKGLAVPEQKRLLNGYNASFINLRRMGEKFAPGQETWITFDFLSSYAHSFPMGFMRNEEDRRDGLANETDRIYIPSTLTWLIPLIDEASEVLLQLPSGMA